jgi:hypothetical protein
MGYNRCSGAEKFRKDLVHGIIRKMTSEAFAIFVMLTLFNIH